MKNKKTIDEIIAEMRLVGEQLMPYNYPNSDRSLEAQMSLVKAKEVVIDGYSLILHYSKNDLQTHMTEAVQIYGKYVPFLPFNLVVKIAKKFLGIHHLAAIEILKDNKKLYCWICIVNKDGKPIPSPYTNNSTLLKYEDLEYIYTDSSDYNLY